MIQNFEKYRNILNIYMFWSFKESRRQLSLLNGVTSAVFEVNRNRLYPSSKFIPRVVRDIGVAGGA